MLPPLLQPGIVLAEHAVQLMEERVQRKWLGEECLHVELLHDVAAVHCRDRDDGDVTHVLIGTAGAYKIAAVHDREIQVDDQGVGGLASEFGERLLTIRGAVNDVALAFEQQGYEAADGRLVLDDEHASG